MFDFERLTNDLTLAERGLDYLRWLRDKRSVHFEGWGRKAKTTKAKDGTKTPRVVKSKTEKLLLSLTPDQRKMLGL